jgi:hypothetical protein
MPDTALAVISALFESMEMPLRYVYLMFHADSNCINGRRVPENVDRLDKWGSDGVILLEKSRLAAGEGLAGPRKAHRLHAADYLFSASYTDTPDDARLVERIGNLLYPEGTDGADQDADVESVFRAAKYQRILITSGAGPRSLRCRILDHSKRLERELGVTVITDARAVEMVTMAVRRRDDEARRVSSEFGIKLPAWVGRD